MLYNKVIFQNCFSYRPRYWYKNIRYIPLYFKRIHHLVKNGYDDLATWDTYWWFNRTMRDILTRYNKQRHGYPILDNDFPFDDDDSEESKTKRLQAEQKWDDIVKRMIFLLGEMDEDTCQKKNPYEGEWSAKADEFHDKYGLFGKGLMTEEERKKSKETGLFTLHTMSEVDEYKDISEKHREAEMDLDKYREQCKDEFFELFSKYYYALWD